jgi:catechol 2,3-dioxygenase-like lactoylglutathione lyase family enzyme
MSTPGTYICARCAVWASARLTKVAAVYVTARRLGRRLRPGRRAGREAAVTGASPILLSTDLDRSCDYYKGLGFDLVGRYDGYLVLHADGVELHLSTRTAGQAPGDAFVHVRDAGALWKRLKHDGVTGLGPVEDQPWGIREFVATDPDGNRIRLGSPSPDH